MKRLARCRLRLSRPASSPATSMPFPMNSPRPRSGRRRSQRGPAGVTSTLASWRNESHRPRCVASSQYRDGKHHFDSAGPASSGHVMVRRKSLVGPGDGANRLEATKALGSAAVGNQAKMCVEPDPFNASAMNMAGKLRVTRRAVFPSRDLARFPRARLVGWKG